MMLMLLYDHRSFIDVWVVTVIVLAIRLDEPSFKGLNVGLWVQAVGEYGVFLFYIAIVLSQVLTNLP